MSVPRCFSASAHRSTQQPSFFACPIAFLRAFPLVVKFLAFRQRNRCFDPTVLVMEVERHERVTRALNLADQTVDLAAMKQKFARPSGIGSDMGRCAGKRRDVHSQKKKFAMPNQDVGFLQIDPSGTDRFHLPTFEHESGFEGLFDEIFVSGFAIFDDGHKRGSCVAVQSPDYTEEWLGFLPMATVHKQVLIDRPAEAMFALVDYCEHYPEFLPWCGGTEVHQRTEHLTDATLKVDFHGVKTQFRTVNQKQPPLEMRITLKEGPFKHLHGHWRFKPLGAIGCKIEFELHYEFANKLLDKVLGSVFDKIAQTFVDAFVARAHAISPEVWAALPGYRSERSE